MEQQPPFSRILSFQCVFRFHLPFNKIKSRLERVLEIIKFDLSLSLYSRMKKMRLKEVS